MGTRLKEFLTEFQAAVDKVTPICTQLQQILNEKSVNEQSSKRQDVFDNCQKMSHEATSLLDKQDVEGAVILIDQQAKVILAPGTHEYNTFYNISQPSQSIHNLQDIDNEFSEGIKMLIRTRNQALPILRTKIKQTVKEKKLGSILRYASLFPKLGRSLEGATFIIDFFVDTVQLKAEADMKQVTVGMRDVYVKLLMRLQEYAEKAYTRTSEIIMKNFDWKDALFELQNKLLVQFDASSVIILNKYITISNLDNLVQSFLTQDQPQKLQNSTQPTSTQQQSPQTANSITSQNSDSQLQLQQKSPYVQPQSVKPASSPSIQLSSLQQKEQNSSPNSRTNSPIQTITEIQQVDTTKQDEADQLRSLDTLLQELAQMGYLTNYFSQFICSEV